MPAHVMLMKLTEDGPKAVKQAPERIEEGVKAFEAMGGKVLAFYATMGEYDYVTIGEGLSEEAALTYVLALSAKGFVRTTTLEAYTPEQFAACCARIPG